MTRYIAAVLAIFAGILGMPAAAQKTQSIAAIVNDDIVSMYDLQSRLHMVIATSGLRNTRQVRERLSPQILRGLIDERIRLQEAKRRNISVTKSNLKRAITTVEKQNRVPPGKLEIYLTSLQIPATTLYAQMRSEIAWSKLVARRLRPRVVISEEEIDEVLARFKARKGQTEYRIAEIFIGLDAPERETEVRRGAERLVQQLRAGARFSAVARQFSESTSAAAGGDLGWIHQTELDDELKKQVRGMKPNQISDPVFSLSGFRIIQLIGKRTIAAGNPDDTEVALRQLFLPVAPTAGKKDVALQMKFAKTLAQTVSGCDDLSQAAKEAMSPASPDLGSFKLRDLSTQIRSAVTNLAVGKASAPLRTRTGIMILMVCRRDEPKTSLPSRKDIEAQLFDRRISLLARRYMRDLRKAAVVDMRR